MDWTRPKGEAVRGVRQRRGRGRLMTGRRTGEETDWQAGQGSASFTDLIRSEAMIRRGQNGRSVFEWALGESDVNGQWRTGGAAAQRQRLSALDPLGLG